GSRQQRQSTGPLPDPFITAPPPADAEVYDYLSRLYARTTGIKDGPDAAPAQGDLGSFVYYDMGRWAFTARPFWAGQLADSARSDTTLRRGPGGGGPGGEGAPPGAGRGGRPGSRGGGPGAAAA